MLEAELAEPPRPSAHRRPARPCALDGKAGVRPVRASSWLCGLLRLEALTS